MILAVCAARIGTHSQLTDGTMLAEVPLTAQSFWRPCPAAFPPPPWLSLPVSLPQATTSISTRPPCGNSAWAMLRQSSGCSTRNQATDKRAADR